MQTSLRIQVFFCAALAGLSSLSALAFSELPTAPEKLNLADNLANKAKPSKPVEALSIQGVHNVFRVSAKLINGSQPEGEAAFRALAALGVKTIITVDGAKPDIETAKKYGMRYVQIPFSYDGLPRQKSLILARAVRELPGLIYLHCHHGKHRSPVAVACALIANEGWSNADALAFLKRAGTGANYTGLWDDVRFYHAPSQEELQKAPADFPAIAPVPSLVQSMVQMDELLEHLQAAQNVKTTSQHSNRHPDFEAPHAALMLREIYHELQRAPATQKRPENFKEWLIEGEKSSMELEAALRNGHTEKAKENLKKINSNCSSCHAIYRNVPQKHGD